MRLRPFVQDDAGALFALQSNPRVMRYWDAPPWTDPARAGFQREGLRREDCVVAGEVSDSWIYGLFLFLQTDDLDRDHRRFSSRGVEFVRAPLDAPYGRVSVFKDLYGNLWDLVQPWTGARG